MSNLFDDDDDNASFGNRNSNKRYEENDELRNIQQKIGHVENESLESTQRALRSLYETREIGVKTAEELVRQGETLNNIDQKLDDVDQTLTQTQKNINQIKSIFGGFKNRFFSSWSSNNLNTQSATQSPDSKASNNMSTSKSFSANNTNTNNNKSQQQKADLPIITGSDREQEINKNLEEMSLGLSHLTSLAKDMQLELDRQNPLIDRITQKTDKTNARIDSQNTQIRKIK